MDAAPPLSELARYLWETRYRYEGDPAAPERTLPDTWRRVARAVASTEADPDAWAARFQRLLGDFRFLPGGRILAGAGTSRRVTLFNCFVMGAIEDSIDGIFAALREGAVTMHEGGGVGYDFSTLRPRGTPARATGGQASGPVSFLGVWDEVCATVLSSGVRRGAMMATLRCDHPDVEAFVGAKSEPGVLPRFNLSVLVQDAFLEAVRRDEVWPLVFPDAALEPDPRAETVRRTWSGRATPEPCRVLRRIPARALWETLLRAAYATAEPGVLFVDRIQRENNLRYAERIDATNPCGEVPLPAYGACNLGSLDLTRFVLDPFGPDARLDLEGLARAARLAVRFLDDVIDVSHYPLEAQAVEEKATRRVGLGITGLADALVLLGLPYASDAGRAAAGDAMRTIAHAAYGASVDLASERGAFPRFEQEPFLDAPFVRRLPADLRDGIAEHGIRNSHLLAVAPAGTISLLAGNVSSGIEPVFALEGSREVLQADGTHRRFVVRDHALDLWLARPGASAPRPATFVEAHEVDPRDHLAMQAAVQAHVDQAIAKTVNVPVDYPFHAFRTLYELAHQLGLKGCTVFRADAGRGAVLGRDARAAAPARPHLRCDLERECD